MTAILSNLNNFHSLEVVDRVTGARSVLSKNSPSSPGQGLTPEHTGSTGPEVIGKDSTQARMVLCEDSHPSPQRPRQGLNPEPTSPRQGLTPELVGPRKGHTGACGVLGKHSPPRPITRRLTGFESWSDRMFVIEVVQVVQRPGVCSTVYDTVHSKKLFEVIREE